MNNLSTLPLTQSWRQEMAMLADQIRQIAASVGTPLRILEAGCGQKWDLNLAGTPFVLIGIDIDEAALEIRKNVVKDLDETIIGDLRSVQLGDNKFDVIFCSYVLEHIVGAELVLDNFLKWLKPNGLIIIQVPDPESVKGFVTRLTPHWFHVLYYRWVRGMKYAGKLGHGPYPTHYDGVISRRGMRDFCNRNELRIKAEYGCGWRAHGRGLTRFAINSFQRMASLVSLGALSSTHDDITFIIQREPQLRRATTASVL